MENVKKIIEVGRFSYQKSIKNPSRSIKNVDDKSNNCWTIKHLS